MHVHPSTHKTCYCYYEYVQVHLAWCRMTVQGWKVESTTTSIVHAQPRYNCYTCVLDFIVPNLALFVGEPGHLPRLSKPNTNSPQKVQSHPHRLHSYAPLGRTADTEEASLTKPTLYMDTMAMSLMLWLGRCTGNRITK